MNHPAPHGTICAAARIDAGMRFPAQVTSTVERPAVHAYQAIAAGFLHPPNEFPAIALIKRVVLGDKIKRRKAHPLHIAAHALQQQPGQATAPPLPLYIKGADIRGEVCALMKVVVYHANAANDVASGQHHIPLRHANRPAKALVDAVKVFVLGYVPVPMKPCGGGLAQLRLFAYADNTVVFHLDCIL